MVQIGGIELQSKSYRPVSLNSAIKKFEKPICNTMHGFWKNQKIVYRLQIFDKDKIKV